MNFQLSTFNFQLIALLLLALPGAAQNKAAGLLDKAATAYENAGGMEAAFTLRITSPTQNESMEGRIQMRGDKFVIQTPDMRCWYDGNTHWTYLPQTGEVNISTPKGDELLQVNPALLLQGWQKNFTAAYKGEAADTEGRAADHLELHPKKKGELLYIGLWIPRSAALPSRIEIEMKNGLHNVISLHDIRTHLELVDANFVFPKKDYPDADIVDLR